MKYDDASWHFGGDFPRELPSEAGATHIAMFVAWAALNGLAGEMHTGDFPAELESLRSRRLTPRQWFLDVCDGKFTDDDLSDDGNLFAASYYDAPDGDPVSYIADYSYAFPDGESLYSVADGWETYATIQPILDRRHKEWLLAR
ncbi:DUF7832 domain-containing protein [Mesorhizobium sp. ORS 3428]|uniref:DUF7832 domain-containing protein n=1 Tax=Mesorhizobium sp. ORS 3428 TaxID=540997 RepID=UPI0008DAFE46|nr:hypothetical protein [Mesorhizobium sp. ORS 3428]OHV86235.1 hypothetical protein ORS3428_25210 [Mesorhizobium sp. ORS 3428]